MFKWLLLTSLVVSLLFCAICDLRAVGRLQALNELIDDRSAELARHRKTDQELSDYEMKREQLRRRIDLINHLKQNQKTVSAAVERLAAAGADARLIDTVAIDDELLRIQGHARSSADVDRLAARFPKAKKSEQPDHTFTLQVWR